MPKGTLSKSNDPRASVAVLRTILPSAFSISAKAAYWMGCPVDPSKTVPRTAPDSADRAGAAQREERVIVHRADASLMAIADGMQGRLTQRRNGIAGKGRKKFMISEVFRRCSRTEPFRDNPILPLDRSEEHTSELQSLRHLVCRLLLEKKQKRTE